MAAAMLFLLCHDFLPHVSTLPACRAEPGAGGGFISIGQYNKHQIL